MLTMYKVTVGLVALLLVSSVRAEEEVRHIHNKKTFAVNQNNERKI